MRTVVRGWRVYLPVVVGNAVVQALSVWPFATPAPSALFIALAVGSFAALVVAVVLVRAQCVAAAERMPFRRPSLRDCIAGTVTVLVVGASAVAFPPLLIVTVTLALIVLAGGSLGFSGFRVFAAHPVRAIALTLLSIVAIVLLWLGAILAGFFITGVASAALTWLVFGVVGVLLFAAWAALERRG